jgi:hypothetical protein
MTGWNGAHLLMLLIGVPLLLLAVHSVAYRTWLLLREWER